MNLRDVVQLAETLRSPIEFIAAWSDDFLEDDDEATERWEGFRDIREAFLAARENAEVLGSGVAYWVEAKIGDCLISGIDDFFGTTGGIWVEKEYNNEDDEVDDGLSEVAAREAREEAYEASGNYDHLID
jgi:hypothetical protein